MKMLAKSKDYLNASNNIISKGNNLHCSVALSYYSVFSYMKFLLANTKSNSKTYEQLNRNGNDPHDEIRTLICESINNINKKDICKRIDSLHDQRVKADYKDTIFTRDDALSIKEEAIKIMKDLKYFFNNLLEENAKNTQCPE